jgi:hypothetical protein
MKQEFPEPETGNTIDQEYDGVFFDEKRPSEKAGICIGGMA